MTDREALNVLNDKRTQIVNPYYSKSELEEIQKMVVCVFINKIAFDELYDNELQTGEKI